MPSGPDQDKQPPRQQGPGDQPPQTPQPRLGRGFFGWMVVLMILAMLAMVFHQSMNAGVRLENWAEFENRYNEGSIKRDTVELRSDRIVALTTPAEPGGEPGAVYLPVSADAKETRIKQLNELTNDQWIDNSVVPWWQVLLFNPLTFMIILIVIFWMLIARGLRSAGGGGGMLGSFGRSKHRVFMKEQTGVTFENVAGVDEAKEEVDELIQFLRSPKKFTRLGGRIPRGVLLVGPPGTGKTLLAKAIAGEADVPFFSISGSDFVEMFVGVGASRVRDLFKQAKESSPCIIFLDEIDAVGRRRGGGFSSGGHDEREQTLNAILVEMDGFGTEDGIIVIAATNRVDVLDPALTRPGRFDRQVTVPLPDVKGRLAILKVHAEKVKMGPDIDLEKIARGTPMFSGADLASLINEAAIAATMEDKDFIEHEDLEEARDKVRFGRAKRSRSIEEDERVATSYHEAGHAVLQVMTPGADPLHKVTIIPRGEYGGASMSLPEKDRYGYGLKWLRASMIVACGGRIAEEMKTADVSSGAAADIAQVTNIAKHMVLQWGMSDRLGFVRYAPEEHSEAMIPDKDYSPETAHVIDEEVRRFVDEAYDKAEQMLRDNWQKVEAVADALLRYETLTAEEVKTLIDGKRLDKPSVSELLAAEAAKTKAPPAKPTSDEDDDHLPDAIPHPA